MTNSKPGIKSAIFIGTPFHQTFAVINKNCFQQVEKTLEYKEK
jgi:hypothetical protein